jgi:copper(I)-binding protein
MRRFALAAILALFAIAPAHAHDYKLGDLTIQAPWSRATPPGAKVGAGYMVIANAGASADRLVSVSASAVTDTAQLHEMGMANGVMTMRALPDGVVVPAAGKVEFKPGGYHVMFVNLKAPLKKGEHIHAHLTFEHAGGIDVDFDIGDIGQSKPMGDMPM